MNFSAQSIIDISEGNLCDLILSDYVLRRTILLPLVDEPVSALARVSFTSIGIDTSLTEGDVDILAVSNDGTANAIAIEFKRIKIGRDTFSTGQPNKLKEIEKAIEQANKLRALGFWKVILAFLVVIDGRERTHVNFAFRGLTVDLAKILREVMDFTNLHSSIGASQFEIVQAIDKEIGQAGSVGHVIHRRALCQTQPRELTEHIQKFFASMQR